MNRTELDIANAFWKLLSQKPYHKITVKNIVEECHINRNTFYYHFKSIPDLLEQILKNNTSAIISKTHHFQTFVDCLIPIVEETIQKKQAILNIYHSIQRDVFIDYLNKMAFYISEQYTQIIINNLNITVQEKDILVRYHKCVIVGTLLDWLDNDANYDLIASLTRLFQIMETHNQQLYNLHFHNRDV